MLENSDTKEEFCGACLAIPLALAGAGVAGAGAKNNKKGKYKKMKKYMLWGGLTITVISVILAIYYLKSCKKCSGR